MADNKLKFIDISGLFPNLSKILPGWIKGVYYSITAGQGVGKSKFARYAFVEYPYKYCKENNIPLTIIYFAHEESVDFFWTTIMTNLLNELFQVNLSYYQLKGYQEGLLPEHQSMIDSCKIIIEDMKQCIKVYDDVGNPTGILKTVEMELGQIGVFEKGEAFVDKEGNERQKVSFKYNNPDHHVIVVNDHVGLLDTELNKISPVNTLHLAMGKWSKYVVQEITRKYNCIAVDVHQQEMSGDNNDSFKLDRLEPSMNKLGDNKLIGRNYRVVLGIFNPFKPEYKMSKYLDYQKIPKLIDNFRTIHVLKHTHGKADFAQPMYFHGSTNRFTELPKPGTSDYNNFITNI